MRPVGSRTEYLNLRNGGEQQYLMHRIRDGDETAKGRLQQMNYSCLPNDDGTLKGSQRMSTTVGMDIDHLSAEEMPVVRERILAKKDELGLLRFEESARGKGYHLVFRRRQELSQEENLKWGSKLLDVEYDSQAIDITRVFFTTTEAQLLYLDDAIFEIAEAPMSSRLSAAHGAMTNGGTSESPCPKEFKGIPYSAIIDEYWRRTGGVPAEGERNKRLHQLAANLRSICDDNEDWLLALMPNIGLPEAEMRSIIHSACKEPTKGSRLMDQIVATLSADDIADIDTDDHECSMVNVQLPMKKLPQGIRESIAAVGPRLAMPIVTAICPCIGALATGVRLDVHGTRRGLNLISYIAGDFASGKGSIDPVVEAWMSETAALDAMYLMQEQEWSAKKKAAKNQKTQPEEPKLPVRYITLNTTVAKLAERLANAEGKHAFSFTPDRKSVV